MIEYLELWDKSLDGSEIFTWMMLNKCPEWKEVEESFDFVSERYGEGILQIINPDILFDEFTQMKPFILNNTSTWTEKKASAETIWKSVFNHHREQAVRLVNMEKLVEKLAFSIPGTSVEVERIFSLINQFWDHQKSQLEIVTLDAILTLQYNSDVECSKFYDTIKDNTDLLEKIHSQEKYQ